TSGPTEPSWASESPQVRDLVEASELALDGGAYMEAATHAYRALKLAPRHRAAQRNGYVACERAVLERLRTRLWLRTRSDEERASHREEALALSKEALSSDEPEELELARESLEQGLRLIPGDRSLERALTRIEGATGTPR
ncbi:MAG: hypothetical protein QGG40_07380, partial [Myxococcota bacterium]|nr:hypothetical protein [Myxococcota bacterium]